MFVWTALYQNRQNGWFLLDVQVLERYVTGAFIVQRKLRISEYVFESLNAKI